MAWKEEGPAIGIDLGTTYSCMVVWKNDRVEIITNDRRFVWRLLIRKRRTRLIGRRFEDESVQRYAVMAFQGCRRLSWYNGEECTAPAYFNDFSSQLDSTDMEKIKEAVGLAIEWLDDTEELVEANIYQYKMEELERIYILIISNMLKRRRFT
ncbi:hypothetical protein Pint_06290 [Pistacia integerrima]|uniref:Uncharacterized protein n=1 Tax=Pistacia integerrima TaxID=434235 RepID=A0ACC0Z411_9ROSI|nr:hypothetical protein Pint_06290 [Pistacia integerrima]